MHALNAVTFMVSRHVILWRWSC